MNHIMLDLETMGNRSTSAIIQIGAVQFDPVTGDIGGTFERNIDLISSILKGCTIDDNTMKWWANQSKEAQRALATPTPISLAASLHAFSYWIEEKIKVKNPQVWGNGATFDNVIISHAYHQCGMKRPWMYRDDRDVRTLVALGKAFGISASGGKREGTYHRGVDDCIYQIGYCSTIWKHLTKKSPLMSTADVLGDALSSSKEL